ncbi:helix-turn-helix domain-containing protein [Enterococcus sp. AZ163]|uniref:helix-turn-helix domain-containing protein n=1 Tax=Enterococcus sp. AZ163 TaxID=2774638 RepID=UPI003D28C42E
METKTTYSIRYQRLAAADHYFADCFTLLMPLKGEMMIEDDGQPVQLHAGTIYCVNLHHLLSIVSAEEDNVVLLLRIDSIYFASQYPAFFNSLFACPFEHNLQGKQQAVAELKAVMTELCINEFNTQAEHTIYETIKLEMILLLLVQHFMTSKHQGTVHSDKHQIKEIIEFIAENCTKGITVKQIADHFFFAESTLSKLFKEETGEYLSQYLKKIQLRKSMDDLTHSKKSIEQIALDNGFKSAKVYRDQFKRLYTMTPTAYRNKGDLEEHPVRMALNPAMDLTSGQIIQLLYSVLQESPSEHAPTHLFRQTKELLIQEVSEIRPRSAAKVIIQIGNLTDLAKQNIQAELLELKQIHALDSISCFHLFPELPLSYTLAKQAKLNSFPAFAELDQAMEFICQNNLQLMLTLSKERYDKYGPLIYLQVMQRMINKFGQQIFSLLSVNFEWSAKYSEQEQAHYFALRKKIQSFSAQFRVGFCFPLPDPYEEEAVRQTAQVFLKQMAGQADFVTFTVEPNVVLHQKHDFSEETAFYHQYVQAKTRFVLQLLKEAKMNVPLYLMEWNTLTGTTINFNGLFFRGALIVQELLQLDQLVDGYGFWLDFYLHEQNRNFGSTDSSGLDLFHFHGHRRPSFFCLQLTRRVTGTILSEGPEHLLTKQGRKYQLLVWNTNYFDPQLSSEEAFLASQSLDLSVQLRQVLNGRFQVKRLVLDRNHGALFYAYSKFQEAQELDEETEAYIHKTNKPSLRVFDTKITDTFSYSFHLDTNAVVLFEFTPIVYLN